MLIRAIVALPGIVAFVLPMTIGTSTGRPVRCVGLAAVPLFPGVFLLFLCVREFYVAGRGTLAPWDPPRRLVTTGPRARTSVGDLTRVIQFPNCLEKSRGYSTMNQMEFERDNLCENVTTPIIQV
jgi:hypothetical protein